MKTENDISVETIYIDRQLDSYKNYLDDKQIGRIVHQLDEETVFGSHFFRLLLELRGIAYNASLPYLMPSMLHVFLDGYVKALSPNSTLLNFSSAIVKRLSSEIPQLTKKQRLSRKLRDRLIIMSQEYLEINKNLSVMDGHSIWDNLLKMPKPIFSHAVWSNQRVSYLSGFSAYDNFMGRVVKDILNLDKCRTTNRCFPDDVKTAFGKKAAELAWTCDEITTLREIRNSLAHAGGKMTDQLRKRKHECVLENDIIQITPKDIKRLFLVITSAVEAIVDNSRDNLVGTGQGGIR